jgi:hypothetical protein
MNETNADTVTGSTNPKLEALYKNALLIHEQKNAEQKRLQEAAANALDKKPVQNAKGGPA